MSDRERRLVERLAAQGDPRAQRQLQIWEAQEWGPLALIPIEQVEHRSATGDREAQAYLRDRYDLRPSERFYQDENTGDMSVEIDLRHSAWVADPEEFHQRAPYTLRLIQRGVIDGEIGESGNTLTVRSYPSRGDPDRGLEVTFRTVSSHRAYTPRHPLEAQVSMFPGDTQWTVSEEGAHPASDTFYIQPGWDLSHVMGRIDSVEDRFLNWEDEECESCGGPANEPWHDCAPYLEERTGFPRPWEDEDWEDGTGEDE